MAKSIAKWMVLYYVVAIIALVVIYAGIGSLNAPRMVAFSMFLIASVALIVMIPIGILLMVHYPDWMRKRIITRVKAREK
jgi:hypothetical protein